MMEFKLWQELERKRPAQFRYIIQIIFHGKLSNTTNATSRNKRFIENPNLPSALRQVGQSRELPVPERPESWDLEGDAELNLRNRKMDADDAENMLPDSDKTGLVNQVELNDIFRG
jgi:hypothetical protein